MRAIAFVLALVLGLSPLEAQVKACQLGTAWAVNPARSLAQGERIVKVQGGVALVSQRDAPGSNRIIFKRCAVPAGTEIVVGGEGPWIKICGNLIAQPEGWVIPGVGPVAGTAGIQGPVGPQGPPGQVVYVPTPTPATDLFHGQYQVRGNGFPTWAKWLIGTGAAVGAGFVVANNWPHKDKPAGKGPGGTIGPAFVFSF